MSIGVAILGGGIFAREEHLPAIEASKHLELKAIWSRSLKSAKTLEADESKVDLYSDDSGDGKSLDDLLNRLDISAVVVALPILNQPDYIRKALLAGKHVLSEKPVSENVADAAKLIGWYHQEIDTSKVTWGVAENFRYLASFDYAAEQVSKMGRILGFTVKQHGYSPPSGKYYETSWRTVPSHQGGFVLDAGVHFVAGLRFLLGPNDPIISVSANTTQLQKHMPPIDTVDATLKTRSGATGTVSISFGTTFDGQEYSVACEKGVVTSLRDDKVMVGKEVKEVKDERTGVPPEIRAWGEGLAAGKPNARQSPEEALADLEVLESFLRSGEQDGAPMTLKYQNL